MRNATIFRLMLVVALIAVNFGLVRFLMNQTARDNTTLLKMLLVGLLPLVDSLIIGLWRVRLRYTISLRKRPRNTSFARWYVLACGLFLFVLLILILISQDTVDAYIEGVWEFVKDPITKAIGFNGDYSSRFSLYVLIPVIVGVLLSGPPLICSLLMATFLSRFQLVLTPRTDNAPLPAPNPPIE